jgi:C4-type Zn-finger protein
MGKECNVCHIVFEENQILNNECPVCHSKNCFEDEYIMDIKRISTDPSFMDAMMKLYKEDPIEYQLKMSQFKTQLQQQESTKQTENIPKCPTCGSTKLSKISTVSKAGSVFLFGLLSQKVKKTWHCDNCKYEW